MGKFQPFFGFQYILVAIDYVLNGSKLMLLEMMMLKLLLNSCELTSFAGIVYLRR